MKIKDANHWSDICSANTGPYGAAIVAYAVRWANLMEEALAAGCTLPEIDKSTSHEANTDGISGFMHSAAVSILADCWEHGEELRRWHNLDAQIHNEGEEANESGGVLNPALLNITN